MSEKITHYREENFSLYQVNGNYTLLLQLDSLTFSYAVVYQNRLMAWAADCDLNEFDDPSPAHDLLTYNYKTVVTGLPSTGFTLVPQALYNADHLAGFARFLDVKPSEKVFSQALDDSNYVIYKADSEMIAEAEKFGLDSVVFMAKGWIAAVAKNNPHPSHIYLNLDKKQVEILYFSGSKLRFYNTFHFNNTDELTYYAIYAAQQLGLEPQNLILILSGDIEMEDDNAKRLAEFFNGVELNNLQTLVLPPQVAAHQIMALAALSLCVSSEVY
jgi:hypothetical protein